MNASSVKRGIPSLFSLILLTCLHLGSVRSDESKAVSDFEILIDKIGMEKKVLLEGAVAGLPVTFNVILRNIGADSLVSLEAVTVCKCLSLELGSKEIPSGSSVRARLRMNPKSSVMRQLVEIWGNRNDSDERLMIARLLVEGAIADPVTLSRTNIVLKDEKLGVEDHVLTVSLLDHVVIDRIECTSDVVALKCEFDKRFKILRLGSEENSPQDGLYFPLDRHHCGITFFYSRDGAQGVYQTEVSFSKASISSIAPSRVAANRKDGMWRAHFVLNDAQASSTIENAYRIVVSDLEGLKKENLTSVTTLKCVSVNAGKLLCYLSVKTDEDLKGLESEIKLYRAHSNDFVASVLVVFR